MFKKKAKIQKAFIILIIIIASELVRRLCLTHHLYADHGRRTFLISASLLLSTSLLIAPLRSPWSPHNPSLSTRSLAPTHTAAEGLGVITYLLAHAQQREVLLTSSVLLLPPPIR
eukprot:1071613-Rhodomonas_salina.1